LTQQTSDIVGSISQILLQFADETTGEVSIDPTSAVFGPTGVITDSLRVLDALCTIEEEFDIEIPDEDLTEELFESVGNLAAYVAAQKGVREPR
jgi:acyl carrier protein